VEPPGPVGVKLPGLLGRIVTIGDLAVVLALDEPDDLAGPEVNGGNHVHIDDLPLVIDYLRFTIYYLVSSSDCRS
jgi:hypothetical protein